MKTSESIKNIATALNLAQSQIKGAIKDASNPFFKSSYADLESVMTALREPCFKNGLSYTQMTGYVDIASTSQLCVITRIMHTSGEWIQGEFPVIPGKQNDPQALGSATSYARRFALSSAFGVYQTDDDGEKTQSRTQHSTSYPGKFVTPQKQATPVKTTQPKPTVGKSNEDFANMEVPF